MSEKKPHIPDLRTYAYHRRAAEILLEHPERLAEIHKILDHWATLEGTQAQDWAQVWKNLIKGLSAEQVAQLIVEKGEMADYIRKSSPVAGLLSEAERLEILQKYRYDYENGTPGSHS